MSWITYRRRTFRWSLTLLALCLLPLFIPAGEKPRPDRAGTSPAKRSLARPNTAGQRAGSIDAGDSYLTPHGRRALRRLPGSVVVRFDSGVNRAETIRALVAANGPLADYRLDFESAKGFSILAASRARREIEALRPDAHRQAIAAARGARGIRSANPLFVDPESGLGIVLGEALVVRLRPGVNPQDYFGPDWPGIQRLRGARDQFILPLRFASADGILADASRRAADPRVSWVEPELFSEVIRNGADPLLSNQWHLNNTGLNGASSNADVNAPEAWSLTAGDPGIVIALLDDGTQLNHPDLSARIFSNPLEVANGFDDDHNGYVDDLHGWNFFRDDNDPGPEFPEDDHGTATAGVAAASANNSAGGAGIAFNCRIMPVKVIGGPDFVSSVGMAEAIYYAAGSARDGIGLWRGADVLSISLSFVPSTSVDDALTWAANYGRGGWGCPIFVAVGNSASRWLPTHVRLDVGGNLGPGTFRFGFEYRKDATDEIPNGEDLVKIDDVVLLAADGITQLNSTLGPNGRQDFEGPFPPPNWRLESQTGNNLWFISTGGALTGTGGSRSARSGAISSNQWTELRTPLITLNGTEILSFACYLSAEPGYDGLNVWVYDQNDIPFSVFGDPGGPPLLSDNPDIVTPISYPASHPYAIAVGASTDHDLRSDYSQYGDGLDFLAPSSGGWNEIITTDRIGADGFVGGDFMVEFGGTSAACPLAAGVGALVLSANPNLRSLEVRDLMRDACDKIGGIAYGANGWNFFYGFGRINAQRSVGNALAMANLQITEAKIVGPDVLLSFTTIPARNHRVEQTTGLGGTNVWAAVSGAASVPGTGGIVTVTDVGGAGRTARLYRVQLLP